MISSLVGRNCQIASARPLAAAPPEPPLLPLIAAGRVGHGTFRWDIGFALYLLSRSISSKEFGGVYAEEELDWAKSLDHDASAIADQQEEQRRLSSIGAQDTITVNWDPESPLEHVPFGTFADRVLSWLEEPNRNPSEVQAWAEINRVAIREFWACCPGEALSLKRRLEQSGLADGQEMVLHANHSMASGQ